MDYILGAVDKVESFLPMEGPLAIPARFAIGAGIGWLVMEAIRPSFAYNGDGTKRPFAPIPELYSARGPHTFLPWLIGPAAGGFLLSTFI